MILDSALWIFAVEALKFQFGLWIECLLRFLVFEGHARC